MIEEPKHESVSSRLIQICQKMAKVCPERIQLVNETAASRPNEPETYGHFLYLDGERVSRSIELFDVMAVFTTIGVVMAEFLAVVWRVGESIPAVYLAIIGDLHALKDLLPAKLPENVVASWDELVEAGRVKSRVPPGTTPSQSTPATNPEDSPSERLATDEVCQATPSDPRPEDADT